MSVYFFMRLVSPLSAGATVLLLLAVLPAAWGQLPEGDLKAGVVVIERGKSSYDLTPGLSIMADPNRSYSIEEVSSGAATYPFTPMTGQWKNLGLTNAAIWLRLRIANTQAETFEGYLTVDDPLISELELYNPESFLGFEHQQQGRKNPFFSKPVHVAAYAFPVSLPPRQTRTLYLRISTGSPLVLDLNLWEPGALASFTANERMRYGLFYGTIVVLACAYLLLMGITRDYLFLWASFFTGFTGLTLFTIDGLAYQYLWPNSPTWNAHSPVVVGNIALLFLLLFTRHLVRGISLPKVLRQLLYYTGLIPPVAIASTIIEENFPISLTLFIFGTLVVTLTCTGTCYYVWRRGNNPAQLFALGFLILFVGNLGYIFYRLGWLPGLWVTRAGLETGIMAQAVFFTAAMGQRIKVVEQARRRAELKARDIQRAQFQQLEKVVADRTAELQHALRRQEVVLEISQEVSSQLELSAAAEAFCRSVLLAIRPKGASAVLLVRPDRRYLEVYASYGLDERYVDDYLIPLEPGKAISFESYRSQQSRVYDYDHIAHLQDAQFLRQHYGNRVSQVMAVPLIHQNQCIGLYHLEHYEFERPFTTEEIRLAESVAINLSSHFVNATLLRQSRQKEQEIQRMNRVLQAAGSSLHAEVVIETVQQVLKDIFEFDLLAIYLLDAMGYYLDRYALYGDVQKISPEDQQMLRQVSIRVDADESEMNYVLRKHRYVYLPRVSAATQLLPQDRRIYEHMPFSSALYLPYELQGQLAGVVCFYRMEGSFELDEPYIQKIQTYVAQIASAVNNARLYEESQQAQRRIKEQADALATNIEQLRATRDQLVQSEKMAALGQLMSNIAHEINTPLAAIATSARNTARLIPQLIEALPRLTHDLTPTELQLLFQVVHQSIAEDVMVSSREERAMRRMLKLRLEKEGVAENAELLETLTHLRLNADIEPYIPLMQRPDALSLFKTAEQLVKLHENNFIIKQSADNTARVLAVIKNYRERAGEAGRAPISVRETLESALALYDYQFRHGVRLVRNYEQIPLIDAYGEELEQVWTNLISNALWAMGSQGTLTISTYLQNEQCVVKVEDTGLGIPPENLEKVFEPFFTTRPMGQGSGLGLDICRRAVARHGGQITVTSQPGHTVFTVYLPMPVTEARPAATEPSMAQPARA